MNRIGVAGEWLELFAKGGGGRPGGRGARHEKGVRSEVQRKLVMSVLLVIATAGWAAAASGADPPGRVVGHLYLNDNTTGVNTVAGFDRNADGTLTPIPGSPFVVGGRGTGHGLASQGSLQMSPDGRYLLAVDAGSNQISVVRMKPDGSLQTADVVSSNGGNPVSIAISGNLVYVANADATSPNYTGFTLNSGGRLTPLGGSTVALPAGSQPGDVLFSADGSKLVGTEVASSLIDSFTVGFDGRLAPAPGSPYPAQGPGPFGSEFRPTNSAQLFVSNAHGGPGNGTVSAFADAADGALTSIGASPFPDLQTAPCWVEISHDGNHLFTVNTADSTISRYAVAGDGSLTLLGSTTMNDPSGLVPEDARLSPDGATLWVVDTGADAVSGFTVTGGALTEFNGSPTAGPPGAAPAGIVVN